MKRLSQFPLDPDARKRLWLFALSGALAVAVGFVAISPRMAGWLIAGAGYYYMLGLFSLFGFFAIRVVRARQPVWREWLRRPGWPALAILAATGFALWSDPFQQKVLFDEYVLQATAYHMHLTKEVGCVIRAYDIDGTWLLIDPFLDKRPFFFTFLLSVMHDLTGYRLVNVFILNSALTAGFLSLTYWFVRELTSRVGGVLAVVLLTSMPLLGQNATGGGMEMHNLAMLMLVMCLALLYYRAPDADRLSLLCLATVLLAESRLVRMQILGRGNCRSEFPAYPRILSPLCGPGWLACGTTAMRPYTSSIVAACNCRSNWFSAQRSSYTAEPHHSR